MCNIFARLFQQLLHDLALFDSELQSLLSAGRVSHDFQHPLLQRVIVPRRRLKHIVLVALRARLNANEMRVTRHLVLHRQLSDRHTVCFQDGHLVRAVVVVHVIGQSVEIFQDHIAPVTVLHIEVNEDKLVFEFCVEQGLVLLVRADAACFRVDPPIRRQATAILLGKRQNRKNNEED